MERARNDLEEHQLTCLWAQAANRRSSYSGSNRSIVTVPRICLLNL
jgi:hypothetical protein